MMGTLAKTEILQDMSIDKKYAAAVARVMKAPLEAAVNVLNMAIAAMDQNDFARGAALSSVASAIAGVHFKKRKVEATRVMVASEIVSSMAGRNEKFAPAQAAGMNAILSGRPYECCDMTGGMGTSQAAQAWISNKIRILRREGYQPRQAAAIAYSMARKTGYRPAKVSGMGSRSPYLKTMALLGMMGKA